MGQHTTLIGDQICRISLMSLDSKPIDSKPIHSSAKRRMSGFTLIEMLLTVALIVLIISMLLPALGRAREETQVTLCQTRMRLFANANYQYALESLGWLLPIRAENGSYWMSNAAYRSMLGVEEVGSDFPEDYRCPSLHAAAVGSGGQQHNFYGWNRTPIGFGDLPITFTRNRVRSPSTQFQLMDGTDWHIWVSYAEPALNWDSHRHTRLWSVAYRHRERVNMTHFDGHIRLYDKDDAYPADPVERDAIWNIDQQ